MKPDRGASAMTGNGAVSGIASASFAAGEGMGGFASLRPFGAALATAGKLFGFSNSRPASSFRVAGAALGTAAIFCWTAAAGAAGAATGALFGRGTLPCRGK